MGFLRIRFKTPLILSILIIFILYQFLSLRDPSQSPAVHRPPPNRPQHPPHPPPPNSITKGSTPAKDSDKADSPHSSKPAPSKPSNVPYGAVKSVPKPAETPTVTHDDTALSPLKPKPKPKAKPKKPKGDQWTVEPINFPLPESSIIPLPKGPVKQLPQIQAEFDEETPEEELQRVKRQKSVRDAAINDWKIYHKEAWGHDEVQPVSGGYKDPFGGWGATLVDALDTLWIMGLKDEFEEAVDKVAEINFRTTPMDKIPIFETTIRYIGGLVAAYDVSEGKYPVLLEKAIEIGDVVYGSFDTKNRMPELHYKWKPKYRKDTPANGGRQAIASELGSLSVEYTRLAQLTGNHSYYDAIARIGNALEAYQYQTKLPGLFPQFIDATGCMRPGDTGIQKKAKEKALASWKESSVKRTLEKRDEQQSSDSAQNDESADKKGDEEEEDEPAEVICDPKLDNIGRTSDTFALGALIDSLYEYLLKEYILLGGVPEGEQYKRMYTNAADLLPSQVLFRPNVPGNPDILFSGERKAGQIDRFSPSTSHLQCFTGGMFAMGSRIFDRPQDLAIGEKLTEGCVWAYNATKSGIMPEWFDLQKCPDNSPCKWDEDVWYEGLLPKEWKPPPTSKKPKKGSVTERLRKLFHRTVRSIDPDADDDEDEAVDNEGDEEEEEGKPMSRGEAGRTRAKIDGLPPGFTRMGDSRYLLRPEAIESVWYMYRITGDKKWMEKGWKMWEAVNRSTQSNKAHSAITDVNMDRGDSKFRFQNSMESFWFGETLKYFYLLFSEPEIISLDDWVLNTEAHPFKRLKKQ